jgi:hypothetical protein
MNEVNRLKSVPGMSLQTLKLIDLLSNGKVGDIITAEAMSQCIGVGVCPDDKGNAYLQSALRYLIKHNGLVWRWQAKQFCVKCLDANEITELADWRRGKIKRESRKACREVAIALDRGAELSDDQRGKALALAAQHGTIAQFAGSSTTKAIEVRKLTKLPTLSEMLGAK